MCKSMISKALTQSTPPRDRGRSSLDSNDKSAYRSHALWDDMDDNRRLLPPGIYLLRLEVETDDATFTASRVVSLAY
jgi:hypothetical protein